MATKRVTNVALVLMAILVVSCGDDRSPGLVLPEGRPSLRLIDSVVLVESDTLALGRPGAYPTPGDGGYYVTDDLLERVVHFSRSGLRDYMLGKRGSGPGEFHGVGPFMLPLDSLLLVESTGGNRLTVFDRVSQNPVRTQVYSGSIMAGARAGDTVYLGIFDPENEGAGAIRTVAQLLVPPDSGQDRFIRGQLVGLPSEYVRYSQAAMFGNVFIQPADSGVLLAFGVANYLVLRRHDGRIDTLDVPRAVRRGVTGHALEKFIPGRASPAQMASAISTVLGLWKRTNGGVVIWYQDPEAKFKDGQLVDLIGRAFLTVLTPDLRQACVDGEVTSPGSGRPRLALVGDTVIALDQVLDPSGKPNVQTVIRRYLLDDSSCRWLPVRIAPGDSVGGPRSFGPGRSTRQASATPNAR